MPVRTCMRSPLRYPEKGFQTIRLPARRSGASRCQSLPCATTWCRPSQFRLVAFTRHLKEAKISNPGFFFLLLTTTEGGPHSHTHFSTRMETIPVTTRRFRMGNRDHILNSRSHLRQTSPSSEYHPLTSRPFLS